MNRKAFTLVEILVVMGFLAILFSLSLPTFGAFRASLLLDASARSVASHLRHVQTQALLKHQSIKADLAQLKLPTAIKIKKASKLCFSSSGFPPPGGSGSIILENRFGRSKKIITSSAGRVRIE